MVGDGKEAPLQIQGPILQTHGRKRNAAAWGRLPAHMQPFRPRAALTIRVLLLATSCLACSPPSTARSHDQRRNAVRARQLARQPHHDPHRAVPRKSPKPNHALANASFCLTLSSPFCEFRHSASTSSATRSLRAESLRPRRHTSHIPRALSSIAWPIRGHMRGRVGCVL